MRYLKAKKAFSVMEIVISMALIAVMSIVGFTVCYFAVATRSASQKNLNVKNAADSLFCAFSVSVGECGVSTDAEQKKTFLIDFNSRLAFALNSYTPQFFNFSGDYSLEGDGWEIAIVNKKTSRYDVDPQTGETVAVQQVECGLNVSYLGNYGLQYEYFTTAYRVVANISVVTKTYSIRVRGYSADSDTVVYDRQENFE